MINAYGIIPLTYEVEEVVNINFMTQVGLAPKIYHKGDENANH